MPRVAPFLLALLLVSCSPKDASPVATRVPLRITTDEGIATLRVEIADSDEERAVGLSNRSSMPANAGMAFLWDSPIEARFWMKDTLIPLQIAFWDEDGRIVGLIEMEPCSADPCPTYGPSEAFVGAAEANAGWFTTHGVREGDTVEFDAGTA